MNRERVRLGLPRATYKACTAVLLVLAAAGCPGTLNDEQAFLDYDAGSGTGSNGGSSGSSGGMCDAPTTVFASSCALPGCHTASSAANAGSLDLVSAGLDSRLVNVACAGNSSFLRINSADPSQSALITKLSSQPPFGLQMPYGLAPLSAAQIQCVTEWVNAQAATAPTGNEDGGGSSSGGSSGSSGSSSSSSSSGGSSSSSSSGGSSSGSMTEAGATVSFANAVYPIIQSNCTSHHSGNPPSGGLDLSSESTAFTNLTTGQSTENGCSESYVVANNSGSSLLYQKVTGNSIPSACGARMPYNGTPLSQQDITIIQNWIQGGAAP